MLTYYFKRGRYFVLIELLTVSDDVLGTESQVTAELADAIVAISTTVCPAMSVGTPFATVSKVKTTKAFVAESGTYATLATLPAAKSAGVEEMPV